MLEINTHPGGRGPFAPPEGFQGSPTDYRDLIRQRWRDNPGTRQQIYLITRQPGIYYAGPYSDEARRIVNTMRQKA